MGDGRIKDEGDRARRGPSHELWEVSMNIWLGWRWGGGEGELHGPPARAVQLSGREQASWGRALCGSRKS